MNEGWTTSRVITILLLALVLFSGWWILLSMDRQQEKLIQMSKKLDEVKSIQVRLETLNKNAVERQFQGQGTQPLPFNGEGTAPTQGQVPTFASADGKDAIGRPLEETPGFTLYPPIGHEIPGRTTKRNPAFIPPFGGTWVQSLASEPDKINYYLTNEGRATRIYGYCHDRLLDVNPDDPEELWPELAVAWEISPDRLTYRFHLRKGVRFSDGSPFGADDVLFAYETIMDPGVESEHLRTGFQDVESVRKLDDYTVEVRMRRKYWKALREFGYSLRPLPREYFQRRIPEVAAEYGIDEYSVEPLEPGFAEVFNKFGREMPPGTGAYQWRRGESWVANQHITLHAFEGSWKRQLNPDYYRLEKMRWRRVQDRVAQFEEFRKGKVDIVVIDPDAWDDQLSKDPTITAIANYHQYDHLGLLFSAMFFNCRRFPFDDVRVRRAVSHLMDREKIHKDVERGRGRIATCPTKPIFKDYSHDIEPKKFDPELAAKTLAEAGWKDSDGDGVLDKNGQPLKFRFSIPSGRRWYVTVATMLQDACRMVGIQCEVDPKEWSTFYTEYVEREFDAASLYLSPDSPWIDPYDEYHSSQVAPRMGNTTGWSNREVDGLLEKIRGEFDDEKRAALFHEFNHIYDLECPELLLIHGEVCVLTNKRLKGVKVRPTGIRAFSMWIQP